MLGNISIDVVLVGIVLSQVVIEFPDGSHLQQSGEDVMHDELFVEGQLVAHVQRMVEEDGQPSLESATDEEQTRASAINKVIVFLGDIHFQAYIDGACNIVGLPLHVERHVVSPRQIVKFSIYCSN